MFTRDTVAPTISSFTRTARAAATINVSVSASDAFSGLGTTSSTYTYYQGSTSKGTSAANTYQYTGLSAGTNYTLKATVKDKAGNVSAEKTLTSYTTGYIKNFAYTGAQQTFTVPDTGKYKLEVWGAQGGYGWPGVEGGYGGYAVGNITLNANTTLYICIGGMGSPTTNIGKNPSGISTMPGGYNGGGSAIGGTNWYGGGGGGASHIALRTGTLSTLNSYRTSVLIVAGGGGGAGDNTKGRSRRRNERKFRNFGSRCWNSI